MPDAYAQHHGRILVVEDRAPLAARLSETLEELGFMVSGVAGSGASALEAASRDTPDVVVMDIELEGSMDGIEAATSIRAAIGPLPVVFITGRVDDATVERAVRAGADGFLVKPFRRPALKSAIEIAMANGRRHRAPGGGAAGRASARGRAGAGPDRLSETAPVGGGARRPAGPELACAVRRGELAVHYQPVFRLADGETEGMEALVRWAHPDRGVLAAGAFVGLAERLDLLRQIDEWVLERVVADLVRWPARSRPRWVSVNLSAASVHEPKFTSRLCRVLPSRRDDEVGERRPRLVVEIAERTAALDMETAERVVSRLRTLGVGAALDDFGTGHSSLAELGRLAVEFLKLDRRFLSGVDRKGLDADATAALLRHGRRLGVRVVAEGVERTSQLEWLQEEGVELVQGYFTGEPASLASLTG